MWKFYLFVLIIVCFVIFLKRFKLNPKFKTQKFKINVFRKKEFLLNVPERKFFEFIQKNIPDDYVIFPQINLSSIIYVRCSRREFWTNRNKINRLIIDFVIFEKKYFKPILAIEYDGQTHNRIDRIKRDNFIDSVLDSVNIKIIHIKHNRDINFEIIKNDIEKLLSN